MLKTLNNMNTYSSAQYRNNAKSLPVNNKIVNFTGNQASKIINLKEWPRKWVYEAFENAVNPYFTMTSRVDVTKLFEVQKEKGIKPSHSIIYLLGKTVNSIQEFKVRQLKNGQIIKYDITSPLFYVARNNSDTFACTSVKYTDNPNEYMKSLYKEINRLKIGGKERKEDFFSTDRDNFSISCLPWNDFTSVSFANFNNEDAKPCIAWGKYVQKDDKTDMAVAIRMHHGFVDGIHVGRFFQFLQENINNAAELFKSIKK